MSCHSSMINLPPVPWGHNANPPSLEERPPWCQPSSSERASDPLFIKDIQTLAASTTLPIQSPSFGPLQMKIMNVLMSPTSSHSATSSVNVPQATLPVPQDLKPAGSSSNLLYGRDLPLPPWRVDTAQHTLTDADLEDVDLTTNGGDFRKSWPSGRDPSPADSSGRTRQWVKGGILHGTPVENREPFTESAEEARKSCVHIGLPPVSSQCPKRSLSSSRTARSSKAPSLTLRKDRWTLDDNDPTDDNIPPMPSSKATYGHRKSSSWTSTTFAGAMKATVSALTPPVSVEDRWKPHKTRILKLGRSNSESSHTVCNDAGDPDHEFGPTTDNVLRERILRRRKLLDELLTSEVSYIEDLKILSHVYLNLLASHTAMPIALQSEVQWIIKNILQLHEDNLPHFKRLLTDHVSMGRASFSMDGPRHGRHQSIESVRSVLGLGRRQAHRKSLDLEALCEPNLVVEIARLFETMAGKLFIYEEYAARYETILRAFDAISKAIPAWTAYERGVEALVNSLLPAHPSQEHNRRGLTIEDLLIKPIQRVCRYPLIFGELETQCPVLEDVEAHTEIMKVTGRLREAAQKINSAIDDEKVRDRIQRAWHLQELLAGSGNTTLPLQIRTLGHAILCGALFIAYHSSAGDVQGQYMLCALFGTHIIFASHDTKTKRFEVEAFLKLSNVKVDEPDQKTGLHCHNAPFSWKLLFEVDGLDFEVILCAATVGEQDRWKSAMKQPSADEIVPRVSNDSDLVSENGFLSLNVKPLHGPAHHINTTFNNILGLGPAIPKSVYSLPIIIENTNAMTFNARDDTRMPVDNSPSPRRSSYTQASDRVPLLAPERMERVRLEQAMADVWTKESLPYPTMTADRPGQSFRNTANSMRRKLSKASITSSPSKRSHSMNSLSAVSLPQLDGTMEDPFMDDVDIVAMRNRLRFGTQDPPVTDVPKMGVRDAIRRTVSIPLFVGGEGHCEKRLSASPVVARKISFCEVSERNRRRISRTSKAAAGAVGKIEEVTLEDGVIDSADADAHGPAVMGRVGGDEKARRSGSHATKRIRGVFAKGGFKGWFS